MIATTVTEPQLIVNVSEIAPNYSNLDYRFPGKSPFL